MAAAGLINLCLGFAAAAALTGKRRVAVFAKNSIKKGQKYVRSYLKDFFLSSRFAGIIPYI